MHMIDKLSALAGVFAGLVDGTRCDDADQRGDDGAALRSLHNSLVQTTSRLRETEAHFQKFQKQLSAELSRSASSTSHKAVLDAFQQMERSLSSLVYDISNDLTPVDKLHGEDSSRAEETQLNGHTMTATARSDDGSQRQGKQNWATLIRGMREFTDAASAELDPIATSLQKTVAWLYADLVLLQSFRDLMQEKSEDKNVVQDVARRIFLAPSLSRVEPTPEQSTEGTQEGFRYRAAERRCVNTPLSAQARLLRHERAMMHIATGWGFPGTQR